MTIVGVWNDDAFPTYLRHFFYTMQLNADVLDLLMINRLTTPDSHCLDFEKAGVNITWGGNIEIQCIDDKEWKRRHVDFLCSSKYGWKCNSAEYADVTNEFQEREDLGNYNWKPFRGYIFRDLFANPENPFWAWLDHDIFVGNFAHYPFNILSQLSILTGSQAVPEFLAMAGQLTAFNMDDEALGRAWKKFPALKTAAHFTKHINGKMPESSEERYWSYGYLRSEENLPGVDLSYGVYPDIHGDDYYENRWNRKNARQSYVISGRDILLVSTFYTRKEIEELVEMERNQPVDDLGGIGWTGGEDGSAYIVRQPTLSSAEAKILAINNAGSQNRSPEVHEGVVDDQLILTNCSETPKWKQCVVPHPLTVSDPPVLRSTLIRFKEQQANHLLRRLERDQRPRGYERKLLKHHLKSKKMPWFEFPPFEINKDLVLKYNSDSVEVFRMGSSRDKTLFYRKEGEASIG